MSADLTPWFPGDVKPVRPGVYQRDRSGPYDGGPFYSEWTGCQWLVPAMSLERASKQTAVAIAQNGGRWRGLAKDPKS